jgi:hypothetical protein
MVSKSSMGLEFFDLDVLVKRLNEQLHSDAGAEDDYFSLENVHINQYPTTSSTDKLRGREPALQGRGDLVLAEWDTGLVRDLLELERERVVGRFKFQASYLDLDSNYSPRQEKLTLRLRRPLAFNGYYPIPRSITAIEALKEAWKAPEYSRRSYLTFAGIPFAKAERMEMLLPLAWLIPEKK